MWLLLDYWQSLARRGPAATLSQIKVRLVGCRTLYMTQYRSSCIYAVLRSICLLYARNNLAQTKVKLLSSLLLSPLHSYYRLILI